MYTEIETYVNSCLPCAKVNSKKVNDAPPLTSIPVPRKVWSQIGIDLIGPLRRTKSGNEYIIACTDYFTKWSEATASKDKSAASVADFIYKTICRFGAMDVLISDQGREFLNQLMEDLTAKLGIDHRVASAYHPQSNGLRERDNRTLKAMINKLINDEGDNWDDLLPQVLLAYHAAPHESTKVIPFQAMLGRKPRLPVNPPTEVEFDPDGEINAESLDIMTGLRETINQNMEENIKKAQMRQKKNFDKRNTCHTTYSPGDIVLMCNPKKKGRKEKMIPAFIGPYEVMKVLPRNRLITKNLKTGIISKKSQNMCNFKKYTPPKSQSTDSSEAKLPTATPTTPTTEATQSSPSSPEATPPASSSSLDATPSPSPPHSYTKHQSWFSPLKKRDRVLDSDTDSDSESKPKRSRKTKSVFKQHIPASHSPSAATTPPQSPHSPAAATTPPQPSPRIFRPISRKTVNQINKKLALFASKSVSLGSKGILNKPRRLHNIRGDGNCFYRAVSYALTGSQEDHDIIRCLIVSHMKGDLSTKISKYLNKNVHKYIDDENVDKNAEWATETEIMATAALLGVDIEVYCKFGGELKWQRFAASVTAPPTAEAIHLDNSSGDHYNFVISVDT